MDMNLDILSYNPKYTDIYIESSEVYIVSNETEDRFDALGPKSCTLSLSSG